MTDTDTAGREHRIRRMAEIRRDNIHILEDGELKYETSSTLSVRNFTKRRCTCGEVFHSDEKAIEHLRSLDTGRDR